MIPIERLFRHRLMVERLDQLQAEISRTSDSIYRKDEEHELIALGQAWRAIGLAMKAMEEAALEVSGESEPKRLVDEVKAAATASLELVNESPERLRREKS